MYLEMKKWFAFSNCKNPEINLNSNIERIVSGPLHQTIQSNNNFIKGNKKKEKENSTFKLFPNQAFHVNFSFINGKSFEIDFYSPSILILFNCCFSVSARDKFRITHTHIQTHADRALRIKENNKLW